MTTETLTDVHPAGADDTRRAKNLALLTACDGWLVRR